MCYKSSFCEIDALQRAHGPTLIALKVETANPLNNSLLFIFTLLCGAISTKNIHRPLTRLSSRYLSLLEEGSPFSLLEEALRGRSGHHARRVCKLSLLNRVAPHSESTLLAVSIDSVPSVVKLSDSLLLSRLIQEVAATPNFEGAVGRLDAPVVLGDHLRPSHAVHALLHVHGGSVHRRLHS